MFRYQLIITILLTKVVESERCMRHNTNRMTLYRSDILPPIKSVGSYFSIISFLKSRDIQRGFLQESIIEV